MSTIAIIAIIVGAAILLALIAFAIFAKPRVDQKRRTKAREMQSQADERRISAEREHAAAAEQHARARREAAEAEERRQQGDRELAHASRHERRARRIDPDR
jgi:flagellar biosynthesis/type III secretory pathway M-ring protein FliF/YscJ